MTDEEKKKKKRQQSWIEEFFYLVMQECTRIVIDYFFDELLGWNYGYVEEYQDVSDLDEIEEWDF